MTAHPHQSTSRHTRELFTRAGMGLMATYWNMVP